MRTLEQRGFVEQRRFDDLGEDADVVTRDVHRLTPSSQITRQIRNFVRPAFERNAERLRQMRGIHAGAPGEDHAVRVQRRFQPAQHDRLGHQCGNLHAQIHDVPRHSRRLDAGQDAAQPRFRQMSGQKKQAFRHAEGRVARR